MGDSVRPERHREKMKTENRMKKALVAGTGVSGMAAVRLLAREGYKITVVDGSEVSTPAARLFSDMALEVYAHADSASLPVSADFDLAVISPAFALTHPWVKQLREAGVETISELELGSRFWKNRILAVTGSKGKSSIVKFCADALNASGISARCAGNYGLPLTELLLDAPQTQVAVVEVSSFQMELTESFSPEVAILLNVQADHLDRHGTLDEYRRLKIKMFSKMKTGGLAIVPASEMSGAQLCGGAACTSFGSDGEPWHYGKGCIFGPDVTIAIEGSWFDNPIFGVSAAAAAAALSYMGLSTSQIARAARDFQPLPHRMQLILRSRNGVDFVDDSKATSLSATAAALAMTPGSVRLIAGGILKEKKIDFLKEMLAKKVKKVYLIGSCAVEMEQAWSGCVPCEICYTIDRAVRAANAQAGKGDTVLLSPGTASFDQFTGYRERGDRFAACVREVADCVL